MLGRLRRAIRTRIDKLLLPRRVMGIQPRFWWGVGPEQDLHGELRRQGYRTLLLNKDIGYEEEGAVSAPLAPELEACVAEVAFYPVCVELGLHTSEIDPENTVHASVIRKHEAAARRALVQIERTWKREPWDVTSIFQGHLPGDAPLRAFARVRGLRTISFELTAHKERLVWELGGVSVINQARSARLFREQGATVSPEEAAAYVQRFFNQVRHLKLNDHLSGDKTPGARKIRPTILLIGQVYTDASLLTWKLDFLTPLDVYRTVIEFAAQHDVELILKLHPKEVSGVDPLFRKPYANRTLHRLEEQLPKSLLDQPNLIIDRDNSFDTYALIDRADVVVAINSQAGLEAAALGRQVICGRGAFYSGLGFTLDYHDAATLKTQLMRFQGGSAPPPDTMAAQAFFHFFYESYCIHRSAEAIVRKLKEAETEV